jgi:hypothetical protein
MRNFAERLRQKMTDRQPYRCHECGWRRWCDVEFLSRNPDVGPEDLRTGRGETPLSNSDVDQLDPA